MMATKIYILIHNVRKILYLMKEGFLIKKLEGA